MDLIKAVLEATANGEILAVQLGTSKITSIGKAFRMKNDVLIAEEITAKYGREVR